MRSVFLPSVAMLSVVAMNGVSPGDGFGDTNEHEHQRTASLTILHFSSRERNDQLAYARKI